MALPLPFPSGIWFFPALNRVTELIKTKGMFVTIIINSHEFNIFLTIILICEILNCIPQILHGSWISFGTTVMHLP